MTAFKLGKMTFGSLFKKPETVRYPFEEKPMPEGLKGHIVINVDDCILCGMCERSCSTGCIKTDKQEGTWAIDRLQCVQCGYCITVCPKKCLHMDPHYAPATTIHAIDSFNVPTAVKPAKQAKQPANDEAPVKQAKQTAADNTPAEKPAMETPAHPKDAQLESLLGMMPPESAEKVRSALM